MRTATAITITNEPTLTDFEIEFGDYRSRIATLSVAASGVLADMFTPLAPDTMDVPTIDLLELDVAPAQPVVDLAPLAMLELVAA